MANRHTILSKLIDDRQQRTIRWYSLFFLLIGVLSPFILTHFLSYKLSQVLLGAGLFLDIVGAIFLVIPDVPSLHKYFFSGKLRFALDHLKNPFSNMHSLLISPDADQVPIISEEGGRFTVRNWIDRSDTGRIDYLHGGEFISLGRQDVRDGFFQDIGFKEIIEMMKEIDEDWLSDGSWDDVFAIRDSMAGSKVVFFLGDGPDQDKHYEDFFNIVEHVVEKLESQFRRVGLTLLISGFILQAASLVAG